MNRLKKLFSSSIIRTLSGGFLLVIIPVMILNFVSGYLGMRSMRDEIDQSYSSNTKLISQQFSDKLRDLEMTSAALFVDDDIMRMSAVDPNKLDLWDYSKLQSKLSLSFNSKFISANVSAIFPTQGRVVSTRFGVEKTSHYKGLSDLAAISTERLMWRIRPSLRNNSVKCLSIIMGYVAPTQSSPLIVIEISEDELITQLASLFQEDGKVLSAFLLDNFEDIIKLDRNSILTDKVQKAIRDELKGDIYLPFTYSSESQRYRIVSSSAEEYQFLIGIVIDENEVLRPITQMIYWLAAILVFAFLAGIAYVLATYRKIYAPAYNLIQAMKMVAEGDFQVRAAENNHTEFGMMAYQFNQMVEQLDKLLKEKFLTQVKLKKAQLKFLKSQINPHFLYNSLFGIYNMIKSGDLDNASDMAIYLGQYYQISAHFDEKDITVKREMENIQLYLQIHQMRAPDKLEYSLNVDSELENLLIPVLSLQTIVENALSHAFNDTHEKNVLTISGKHYEWGCQFIITDNGAGVCDDTLKLILNRLTSQDDSEETHGLQNVFLRLKLLFGEAVIMKIENVKPHGTQVIINIPLK